MKIKFLIFPMMIIPIMIILFISLLVRISVKESDTYRDRMDEIQYVSIVEIGDFNQDIYRYDERFITEITDITSFKKKLADIKWSDNLFDPIQLEKGDTVIKIVYTNGDFYLIGCFAQLKNIDGINYEGFTIFDEEQFFELIHYYTDNQSSVSYGRNLGTVL